MRLAHSQPTPIQEWECALAQTLLWHETWSHSQPTPSHSRPGLRICLGPDIDTGLWSLVLRRLAGTPPSASLHDRLRWGNVRAIATGRNLWWRTNPFSGHWSIYLNPACLSLELTFVNKHYIAPSYLFTYPRIYCSLRRIHKYSF